MINIEFLEHMIVSLDLAKKMLDDTMASAGRFALRKPSYGTEAELEHYNTTFVKITELVKKSKVAYVNMLMAANNICKPHGFEIVYSENDNKHYLCTKES